MGRRAEGWKLTKLPNGTYGVRFTIAGERIHRSTGERTARAAAKVASETYAKAVRGELPSKKGHVAAGSPLNDLVSEWLVNVQAARSPEWHATLERYSGSLWLTRWQSLSDIDPQSYIRERLKDGISPVTLHKELTALRRFFKWCVACGHLAAVPRWEAPKPTSDYQSICLTAEQVRAVLAELPNRRSHPKHFPAREWFTIAWETGFRKGTLARLTWRDIDLREKLVQVSASKDKARFARPIPLTDEAVKVLESLERGKPDDLVFGQLDLRGSLEAAAEKVLPAELAERLSPHVFRHSRITHWASRTSNVAALQYLAGHKVLSTTQRYLHPRLDDARQLLKEADIGQNRGQTKASKKPKRAPKKSKKSSKSK